MKLSDEQWSRYDRCNAAIAEEFFTGAHADRPVYLDLEPGALAAIAARAGEPTDDPRSALIDAVSATLILAAGYNVFGRHRQRRIAWRLRRDEPSPPPTLGVLALLSLVAESMRDDGELAATAYYARVAQTIGGDRADAELRKRLQRGHRSDVIKMWAELNAWLAQDPTRGIPTAQAFDHRTYIGPALTQALVREADRDALKGVFEWAHLVPDQSLTREDMARLLRGWLPTAQVSKSLKSLAKLNGAIEQIADVALAELASWNGGTVSATRAVGLRLTGRLRRRPRRRLDLAVLARLPSGPAELVVGDCQETVALAQDDRHETSGGPAEPARLLNAVATLSAAGGASVTRAPRPLVVLKVDADRARLIEVDRVLLGEEHVLLVRDTMLPRVQAGLDLVARPGWELLAAVAGLPAGWAMLTGVEIVALGDFKDARDVLVPTGWSQLSLRGGLRLPGRATWLASAPPTVSVTVLQGGEVDLQAEIVLDGGAGLVDELSEGEDDDLGDADTAVVMRRSISAVSDVDLADYALGSCRLVLIASRGDEAIGRTACTLVAPQADAVAHDLAHLPIVDPRWAISAGPNVGKSSDLRGALTSDALLSDLSDKAVVALPSSLDGVDEQPQADAATAAVDPPVEAPIDAPECFRTGFHVYPLPPGRHRRTLHVTCKHCGRESFIPPRAGAPPTAGARTARLPARPSPTGHTDDDVLFALSALGSGNRYQLERIIDQVDDAPWALGERAHSLSSLGHVDLQYDQDGRVAAWGIAPPALARSGHGELLLCGWRSPTLLTALDEHATALGLLVLRQPNDQAPSRISVIDADDASAAAELANRLRTRIGHPVPIVDQPGARLAAALPEARALLGALPARHPPAHLEWLEPSTWAWESRDRPGPVGAYRTARLPRRSFYFDGTALRACEGRLARWLAVRPSTPRMAYDQASGTLTTALGGRLPGLWERAAVLASGWSAQGSGGRHFYRDVPAQVATHLARTLATNTERITIA